MRRPRVRHHTSDAGLKGIRREGLIHLARGWGAAETGVHAEMEPFGTTRPFREGRHSPKADLGLEEDGAYVEFDAPAHLPLREYACGPRRSALIVTNEALPLAGLNAIYVHVRRYWWQFWRSSPE